MATRAAVCLAAGTPLVVQDVEGSSRTAVPTAAPGQIIIRTAAVAINPFDCAMQAYGSAFFPFVTFPYVFGEDVSGTVEAVGDDVTQFKIGDRVAGLSVRTGFQERVVLSAHMSFRLPPNLPFDHAAVLPMGVVVAMQGLFHPDYLRLHRPGGAPTGEAVLVWGASTCVGSNAVQMAAAAGYEVVTTASPSQFAAAKKLGASQVYDYASPTVVADIQAALKGKKIVGAFCNGAAKPATFPGIIAACADIVRGQERPFLALTMVMPAEGLPAGVEGKFIAGVHDDPAFSSEFLGGYVTEALADGRYQIAPTPKVVGHGLEAIQGAMDTVKAGVSATKIVVTL